MCHMHFLWVEILVEAKCNNCHAQPNREQIPPPLSRLQSWTVGCQHPVEHIKTPHAFVPPCTMCGSVILATKLILVIVLVSFQTNNFYII